MNYAILIDYAHKPDALEKALKMKPNPMFTVEEKVEMVRKATERYPNVTVDSWDGLLAEYARQYPGAVIVKGLRAAGHSASGPGQLFC